MAKTLNKNLVKPEKKANCVIAGDQINAGVDADDAKSCELKNAIVITFKNKEDMGKALREGKVEFEW